MGKRTSKKVDRRKSADTSQKMAAETGTSKAKPDHNKKISAIDAAAKVLAETGEAMTCQQMIEAMSAKGYWTSPRGKTPHATLYSAILREINTKGHKARFKKAERGTFTLA